MVIGSDQLPPRAREYDIAEHRERSEADGLSSSSEQQQEASATKLFPDGSRDSLPSQSTVARDETDANSGVLCPGKPPPLNPSSDRRVAAHTVGDSGGARRTLTGDVDSCDKEWQYDRSKPVDTSSDY